MEGGGIKWTQKAEKAIERRRIAKGRRESEIKKEGKEGRAEEH